ncbi:MAG: hypothetical protein IJ905_07915 [Fibrobacter sp.]|nr:hypothetical protein [Fibrobacter sp.]
MKIIFHLLLICFLLLGCSSSNVLLNVTIPGDKDTIYLIFDNTQSTISSGGIVVGNMFFTDVETASFNSLENRMLAKSTLSAKGYKITNKIEKADLFVYGGCESNEIQSKVMLVLVDAKTEKEYVVSKGTYGMGWDLNGDIKGALKNALDGIPNR